MFEWNVMLLRLCNTLDTLCRLMEQVLTDICWQIYLVYLDDIVALGDSFTMGWINVCVFCVWLWDAKLKCELFHEATEYMVHQVSHDCIWPSLAEVDCLHY